MKFCRYILRNVLTLVVVSGFGATAYGQNTDQPTSTAPTPVPAPPAPITPLFMVVAQAAEPGSVSLPLPPVVPPTEQGSEADIIWANILGAYARPGDDGLVRFDYAALKSSPENMTALADYIGGLAAQTPSTMIRKEAMAYWANLYNALTVQVVAENYPVKSILKIKSGIRPGPWKRKLVTVESRELSLDNIEHDIMRPTFNTPLVHYMVNCASVGCPNLKPTPWQAVILDVDLDAAARAYINSPRGASFTNGRLQVSKIYKWFKKDFGGNSAGVLAHLRQYADMDLLAQLNGTTKIKKYNYDWGVNAP